MGDSSNSKWQVLVITACGRKNEDMGQISKRGSYITSLALNW